MLESCGFSKESCIEKICETFEENYPDKPSPTCIPQKTNDMHIFEIFK